MHRVVNIIHKASAVAMLMIVGCATLPDDFDRSESYALTDTENTTFGRSRAAERAHTRENQDSIYWLTAWMPLWPALYWRRAPIRSGSMSLFIDPVGMLATPGTANSKIL